MNIKHIQTNILSRYAKNGRNLPRRQTKDPYAIHVSEVMLQQTQVDRVIPYFLRRMKDFPDYQSLAKASKTDLLKHRSGLGFNSRALRLQSCAQAIVTKKSFQILNSKFQISNWKINITKLRTQLQKLPWIGPYTSAAIMSFARNVPIPVIDTNIRRVLIFLCKLPESITAKELETFATKIIPPWKSRDRHNALMDQWALLLTARKTKIKPLSKQSKFEGSDRQVRWRVMKQLIKNWQLKMENIEEEFPRKKIKDIMKGLQKEWLINISKWVITIAE